MRSTGRVGHDENALGTGAHLLQFADIDENQVARNVAQFLFDGVVNGEPCMVMATEAHLHAFRDALLILDKDLDLTDRQTFCFLTFSMLCFSTARRMRRASIKSSGRQSAS